jgi:hypothetical protein
VGIHAFGDADHSQLLRDLLKEMKCLELDLQMIEIPFWWDGNPKSLKATIAKVGKKFT